MSSREVFFLLGADGEILYRDEGTSPTYIPDSRDRWEAIWRERERLTEIAHSHPIGPLAFSTEDETTMEAVSSALGRAVRFSVVTAEGALRREVFPGAGGQGADSAIDPEPDWVSRLRRASGM
ncbi:MAG: hypothetical protein IPG04_39940 [Polyangiaceae bacterium]|nr:hypothetical protein [Polyangiaceae bacterium]